MSHIAENIKRILDELPEGVTLEAAVKTRSPEEIIEARKAGITVMGENYIQEAEITIRSVGHDVRWHFIGHLQKNKVKKAVELFDMIETVDSFDLASLIDKQCQAIDKIMPVLIEVNSGREPQKSGVFPEDTDKLVRQISDLEYVRVTGLMTMGPAAGDPEESRPFFRETKRVFDEIKTAGIPKAEMKHLSMGMTNSYTIAIEEGANIVRLGSIIFGPRI